MTSFKKLALHSFSSFLFATLAHAQTVTELRFQGVNSVPVKELEAQIQISTGEQWKEKLRESMKSTLVSYYAKRGFYNAKVSIVIEPHPEMKIKDGVAVAVNIEEGKPCIIAAVGFPEPADIKSISQRRKFMGRVRAILGTKEGERYDEQVLGDKLREVRDWLVEQDYILSSTEDVNLDFNDDFTSVKLDIKIEYGERVSFGYQGNTVFTKGELNEIVKRLRDTDLGKDFVGVITRSFVDAYNAKAYNLVEVTTRIVEKPTGKHVTFFFKENTRTQISSLTWEGLTEENLEIARDTFNNGVSRLVQRHYYVEKDIEKGIEIAVEDLRSRGYLSAKLISKSVFSPTKKDVVDVVIQLSEGEQTVVHKVNFRGFQFLSRAELMAILGIEDGKPFNPFLFEDGLQALRSRYQEEGFLEFRYSKSEDSFVVFGDSNRSADIEVSAFEGLRIKVDEIKVRGLQKTLEYVVTREIEASPNDWWLASKVRDTDTNLRQLGIFSEVRITAEQSERGPEFRNMVISVTETDPGAVEFGPGFRSDLGFRAFGRISYNNIAGKNWIAAFTADANRRLNSQVNSVNQFIEYRLASSFIEPRLFGTRNMYIVGLDTKKERFPPDFNASTTQLSTGLERRQKVAVPVVGKLPTTLKLLYRLERIRQFDVVVNQVRFDQDNKTLLIGSLNPSIAIDTRDSPFTTTRGVLTTLALEYANPFFAAQKEADPESNGYTKWTGSAKGYIPLTKDIVWSNVFAGGFARSNIPGRAIPLIKLFRLGGYSTIRGFREDAINLDTFSITGTMTYLNLRTEFLLPLVGELKLAPFLDAGNVFKDSPLRNHPFMRAGAGMGLHYMTPIGPINFDLGFKLNPNPGEKRTQFHFSVGMI